MKYLTCMEKVRCIYTTMAAEVDKNMSWERALETHKKVCKLGEFCGVRIQEQKKPEEEK